MPFTALTLAQCRCGAPLPSPRARTCGRRACSLPTTKQNAKIKHKPIGIDGEGEDGRYTLLAASTGDYIANRKGLQTADCFDFLFRLPKTRLLWGFAFSYDVNMMLVDLSLDELQRLANTTRVYHGKWRIEHIPGKKFMVTDRELGQTRTIWDMYPWRASSFVSMLEDWKLCDKETLERIAAMKDQRSHFSQLSDKQILSYCLEECRLLETAVTRLLECVQASGYTITQFHSPGSLASAAMKAHNIENYKAPYPEELEEILVESYAGGRSEVSEIGPINQTIYEADIHSAYPYAAVQLPCFAHGRWVRKRESFHQDWSLLRVRFKTKRNAIWGPYPMRGKVGSLRYPTSGTVWIWRREAMAGKPLCTEWEIIDGWEFTPECDHKPFAYLAEMYEERRRLVLANDPNEYTYKLILNSTYGKLGERPRNTKRLPRWRFLPWASLITSMTRAMLLEQIVRYGSDVLLVATDCIITKCPIDLDFGEGLGEWELKEYEDIFIVGPGIYYAGSREKPKVRSRGIAKVHISFDNIQSEWERNGRNGAVTVDTSRFVGYKVALRRRDTLDLWRQFVKIPLRKNFSLYPRRLWINNDPFDGRSRAPTLALHNQTVIDDLDHAWQGKLMAELGNDLAQKLIASARFEFDVFPMFEQPDYILEEG